MTIAIIGASGQLGRLTTESLLEQAPSRRVVAVVRSPEKVADLVARGVEARRADLDDRHSLVAAFAGADTVHIIPTRAAPAPRCVQLDDTIQAARAAGVRKLVHVGIVGTAIDNPFAIMPYLCYAESAIRCSGLSYTLLRNAYYSDAILSWLPQLVELGTVPYPTAGRGCAYASREDLARGAAAVLAGDLHTGEVVDLTGPELLTTADLCRAISEATGAAVVDSAPDREAYISIRESLGDSRGLASMLVTLYDAIAQGFMEVKTDSIARLTGTPPRRFAELVRDSALRDR